MDYTRFVFAFAFLVGGYMVFIEHMGEIGSEPGLSVVDMEMSLLAPIVTPEDLMIGAVTGKSFFDTRLVSMDKTWIPDALKLNISVAIYAEREHKTPFTGIYITPVYMDPITYLHGLTRGNWDHGGSAFKFYAAVVRMAEGPEKMFYFLGDDDTLLFPQCFLDRLNELVASYGVYNPDKPLWLGQKCGKDPVTYCGGGGLLVNRAAMVLLRQRLPNCLQIMREHYGDVMISKCFKTIGVELTEVPWMRSQPPLWFWTKEGKKDYPKEKNTNSVCTFHYVNIDRLAEMLRDKAVTDSDVFEMTYHEHRLKGDQN